MGITVRESLALEPLCRFKVLTGEAGLENMINAVTVLDAPDSIYWVRGQEFILTTGFGYKDNKEKLMELLPILAKKQIAAVAIKVNRFLQCLPDDFVAKSIELNIPVFMMPDDCTYCDVLVPLYRELFYQNHLAETHHIFDSFYETISCQGNSFDLVDLLARQINLPVLLLNGSNSILYISRNAGLPGIQRGKSLQAIKEIQSDYEVMHFPFSTRTLPEGSLAVLTKHKRLQPRVETIINEAVAIITVQLIYEQHIKETSENELFCSILKKSETDQNKILRSLLHHNLNYSERFLCLVVALDSFQHSSSVKAECFDDYKNLNKGLTAWARETNAKIVQDAKEIIILVPAEKNYSKKEIQKIVNQIVGVSRKATPSASISVGVSYTMSELPQCHIGYNEAIKALRVGTKISGDGSITYFNDLGIYRLLSEIDDVSHLEGFYQNSVNNLIRYDEENHTEFYKTLEMYCKNNSNLKETALQLNLHYNSLQYRLKKISEITHLNIACSEGFFNLMIGIKIKNLLHNRQE